VATLLQLKNVETYRPCEWDLKVDPAGRQYWADSFCTHLHLLETAISEEYPDVRPEKLAAFRTDYVAAMRALDAEPDRFERIDILYLDEVRSDLLQRYGFDDPYRGVKARENEVALELLPDLLHEIDGAPSEKLIEKLAFGLMAGNLFDLGALAAIERYQAEASEFRQLRDAQPVRPWFIDGVDAWRRRWSDGSAYEHVAFFVDNAGSDICLGCFPFIRWMLQKGSRVTLVANTGPALNDVTASEILALLDRLADLDHLASKALASGRLAVIASGNSAPLIDLTRLTKQCAEALGDADLIILHGMGRAIESNYRAAFSCECLRSAVLKVGAVARRLGGRLFDCVFQLQRAS
jgi:uncharacterized protein with ATP-grasp and redox domains